MHSYATVALVDALHRAGPGVRVVGASGVGAAVTTAVKLIGRALNRGLKFFDLLVSRRSGSATLDSHLQHVFAALDINCVLDVGAHQGHYGAELRKSGYKGRIVSFEPVTSNCEKLRERHASDADWRTYRVALGDENAMCDIHLFEGSTFASLLRSSPFGRHRFGDKLQPTGTERVEVRRLEDVFAEAIEGLTAPRVFLKIDTQGYDLAVLRGAGARLRDILGVQMELTTHPLYMGATNVLDETLPVIRNLGFSPTAFFPVSYDADNLLVIEYDGVFCRPALAASDRRILARSGRTS